MEFARIRVRGRTQKTYREWRSDCGNYRIVWRIEVFGVEVPPRFYATVQTIGANNPWWDFVGRRGPYKTFKKAVEDCERNKKLWTAFVELGQVSGRRSQQLAALNDKAKTVFSSVPVWVKDIVDPVLLRMQFPCPRGQKDHNDHLETSTSSDEASLGEQDSQKTPDSGPALSVEEGDSTTTQTIAAQLKATSSPQDTSVPTVKAPAKGRGKKSPPPTDKSLPSGKQKTTPGKPKKPSAKADSTSSRKKKGKP